MGEKLHAGMQGEAIDLLRVSGCWQIWFSFPQRRSNLDLRRPLWLVPLHAEMEFGGA